MPAARSQRGLRIFTAAFAVSCTAWVMLFTHYVPRMAWDMAVYLSAAENLAAGNGLTDFLGNELTWFPPGLSIWLAGVELVGLSARDTGLYLQAVLLGATVLMAGLWLTTVCRSAWVVVAAVLTLGISRNFQHQAITLHSEPLYLVLTIGSLICVSEYLKLARTHRSGTPSADRRAMWLLLAAGLLAGLSGATRYIGVVAIASSFAVILWWRPSLADIRARLRHAVLFGAVASLPVIAVLARNLSNEGALLGVRFGPESAGWTHLETVRFLFEAHYRSYYSFAVAPAMLITAGMVWLAAAARSRRARQEHPQAGESTAARKTPARFRPRIDRTMPFAAFWVVYCAALVMSQPHNNGPLNYRIYLPGMIALLFVGCEALDTALGGSLRRTAARDTRLKVLLAGSSAFIVIALAAVVNVNLSEARAYRAQGSFGNDQVSDLTDSPTIAHLRHNHPQGVVYSNRAGGVYLLTGIQPVHRLLHRPEPWTDADCIEYLKAPTATDTQSAAPSEQLTILWFIESRTHSRGWLSCDIADLSTRRPELQALHEFADGGIYRFAPARAGP